MKRSSPTTASRFDAVPEGREQRAPMPRGARQRQRVWEVRIAPDTRLHVAQKRRTVKRWGEFGVALPVVACFIAHVGSRKVEGAQNA